MEKGAGSKLWCSTSKSKTSMVGIADGKFFGEVKMGKYIAYIICVIGILIALEYFKIVDVPYLDLPDLQTKGEQIKEKSEDNMQRRFGD